MGKYNIYILSHKFCLKQFTVYNRHFKVHKIYRSKMYGNNNSNYRKGEMEI